MDLKRALHNTWSHQTEVMVLFVCRNGNPGTNVDFASSSFFNRMVNPYGKFSESGFPHNFTKNDRQDLKMGCTDVSRRQLQSVLKIGVYTDFSTKLW
jgi:hypothetical protein